MNSTAKQLIGNTFLHPILDYVLIGSAWSIIVTLALLGQPSLTGDLDPLTLAVLILLVNSAHFAASTLRLYSKPSFHKDFPFLTYAFPIITIAVLSLCVAFPALTGKHLQALYLTWSPYHYAAQIYGLTMMYSYRSGLKLTPGEKRVVYWTCLLPFLRAFLGSPTSGLGWFVSRETIMSVPLLPELLGTVTDLLLIFTFLGPCALFVSFYRRKGQLLPLITLVMMISNGLWWIALDYLDAFVLATIAHGLQYLAIVIIYHIREQVRSPGNRHGWLYHTLSFYGKCVLLGYGLFYCWPYAYVWAGAGLAESMLLVTATINIHHFVVDRYIWRLRSPSNAPTLQDVTTPVRPST